MALTLDSSLIKPSHPITSIQAVLDADTVIGAVVDINSDGEAVKARANAAGTAWGRGIVIAGSRESVSTTRVAGETVTVMLFGILYGFTGMDITKPVYVSSSTAGELTQTAPSGAGTWTAVVGYPVAEDVLMVAPSNTAPTSNS